MSHTSLEILTWTPADQGLPEPMRTVLIWSAGGFATGYWDTLMSGWIGGESGGSIVGVTHWAEPVGPLATSEDSAGARS